MRHFLKSIVLVVFILAIVFVASPLAMSFWLQKHYQRILNQLTIPNQLSTKVLSFNRGWFKSTAKVQVNLKMNTPQFGKQARVFSFIVDPTILQGPFIMTHDFDGKRVFFFGKAVIKNKIDNANVNMQSIGFLHWNDMVRGKMELTQANVERANVNFHINNMHSRVHFTPASEELKGAVSTDNITIQTKQNNKTLPELTFKKLNTQFNVEKVQALWVGKRSVNIDSISATMANKPLAHVDRLMLHSKSLVNNNKLSGSMNLHMNKLVVNNLTFAPIKFDTSIQNLDVPTLVALMNTLEKLEKNVGNSNLKDVAMLQLYQPAMHFLSKGFTASLDKLMVGTAEGAVTAKGKLVVPAQENADDLPYLLRHIDATFSATFPRALLNKILISMNKDSLKKPTHEGAEQAATSPTVMAQEQIQEWINSNLLVEKGDNLIVAVTFSKGELLVNGKTPNFDTSKAPIPTAKPKTVTPPLKPANMPFRPLQTAPVKINSSKNK